MEADKLKCISDLAVYLKVHRATIHSMLKKKKYPTYVIGKRKFYNPKDFLEDGK